MKPESSQSGEYTPRAERRTRRPGRVLTAVGSAVTAVSLLGSAAPAAASERQSASKSIEAKEKKAQEAVFAPILQTSSDPQELINQHVKNVNKYYRSGDDRYLDYALHGSYDSTLADGSSTPGGADLAVILAKIKDSRKLSGDKTYSLKYVGDVLANSSTDSSMTIIVHMLTKHVGKIIGGRQEESWYSIPFEPKEIPDPNTGELTSVWLPTIYNELTEQEAVQLSASPDYQ